MVAQIFMGHRYSDNNCKLGEQTQRGRFVSFPCHVLPAELPGQVMCEQLFPNHRRQRVVELMQIRRRGAGRLPCMMRKERLRELGSCDLRRRRLRGFLTADFSYLMG